MVEDVYVERAHYVVDGSWGIYCLQKFAERFDLRQWGVEQEDIDILLEGPDHEWYFETWDDVIDNAEYVDDDGYKWFIWSNDGVFIVREDMPEEWFY